jgi:hypothetical protein
MGLLIVMMEYIDSNRNLIWIHVVLGLISVGADFAYVVKQMEEYVPNSPETRRVRMSLLGLKMNEQEHWRLPEFLEQYFFPQRYNGDCEHGASIGGEEYERAMRSDPNFALLY